MELAHLDILRGCMSKVCLPTCRNSWFDLRLPKVLEHLGRSGQPPPYLVLLPPFAFLAAINGVADQLSIR
jgi:hypothetical protein